MTRATGPRVARTGRIGALLLTGGASRRMGVDKATLLVGGVACAARLARLLHDVADTVLEVGPGRTPLEVVAEPEPGSGPLAAIAAGRAALVARGLDGPAVVCACDLPSVTAELLELVARRPGTRSVLPVVGGRAQPLLARWSAADLDAAAPLVAAGERSLRTLPSRAHAELLDEASWSAVATAAAFADLDTPEDLAAFERGHRGG